MINNEIEHDFVYFKQIRVLFFYAKHIFNTKKNIEIGIFLMYNEHRCYMRLTARESNAKAL